MPAKILIVDDQSANRLVLERMVLGLGHQSVWASDGAQAIEQVRRDPPDLILLDLLMPRMSGFEVLKILKRHPDHCRIPVIIVSGDNQTQEVVRCLRDGADDFVSKPFDSTILSARIESSLAKKRLWDWEREQLRQIESTNSQLQVRIAEQLAQICSAQQATIFALSKLTESRDNETGQHLERIREYCRTLAQTLAKSSVYANRIDAFFIDNLFKASPLHDIGKVGIPDAILRKPGLLTPEEFEVIKTHTTIGAKTLWEVNLLFPGNAFIECGAMIAESHHERWDGRGYPHGASGENIPLAARIVAVADVYDALTTKRCYKPAMSHEESVRILLAGSAAHFDPIIIAAFRKMSDEFQAIRQQFRDPDASDLALAMANGNGNGNGKGATKP